MTVTLWIALPIFVVGLVPGCGSAENDDGDMDATSQEAAEEYPACPSGASCEDVCVRLGGGEFCANPCPSAGECPAGGECVVQLDPGPATRCGLVCDPTSPACPAGMQCFDLADDPGVVADAVCAWPNEG